MYKKSWDETWEQIFSSRDWGKYPPEELIRFIARNFGSVAEKQQIYILDAGCGTGAGCWYTSREGYTSIGLDGSLTALLKGAQRFKAEKLLGHFVRGDLIALPFKDSVFDVVIDICSITQNRFECMLKIFDEIKRVLKPNGHVFSMQLAVGCWGDGMGRRIEDGTYTDIPEGPLKNVGVTHFTSESEIPKLLHGFSNFTYEISTRTYNERTRKISLWVITARK